MPPEKNFTRVMTEPPRDPLHTARINCFLTLKDDKGPALRLDIANIEIIADGFSLPVAKKTLQFDSAVIGTSQLFLGGVALPPGRYFRLRFTVTKGEMRNSKGKYINITPEPLYVDVNISAGLNLDPEDSSTLLITWDVQNSLLDNSTLSPDFTAISPLRQMLVDLVFVACPDINTVFVVRPDKNWIVDSFGLKGGPTYLAIDPVSQQLLYVLTPRDGSIKVIELSTFRVVNFFSVPLNDNPIFMALSPDGESAYLLDDVNGYLSRIDMTTGQILARVLLSDQPIYAAYLKEQNQLAVSLSLSQKVLLLDPANLTVNGTIITGSAPRGMALLDNRLIIAEYGDNTVSIVDLANRGAQSRLAVGFGPHRLLETGNQVYVTNYLEGSLSVLEPGQLGVIQDIYGLGRPLEMTFDQSNFRLYVADEESGSLAVIDTNSNKLLGHITLGARPSGMDVIQ
jgi:YVTN family beta-propeller protein